MDRPKRPGAAWGQWLPFIAVHVALLGCAGDPGADPRRALADVAAAMQGNLPGVVYDRLSEETRRGISRETFVQRWRELRPEISRQAAAIRRKLDQGTDMTTRATFPSGMSVGLRLEKGRWVITEGVMLAPDLSSPEGAVRALATALDRRNAEGVLRLLTEAARKRVEGGVDDRARNLRQALEGRLTVEGDRARLPYGTGRVLELERRGGSWRIRSLE